MAGSSESYADVRAILPHPIERVWSAIADFGGIGKWAADITACDVEGEGPGAVRTVFFGEYSVREQLDILSQEEYLVRYHVVPPHTLPANNVNGNMRLFALDDGRTEMSWISSAADFQGDSAEYSERITDFYNRSVDGLREFLLRNG